ncbi:hypothetical protein DL766_006233 [Monosporascus sp. MC13-8B]|nr:hypothetical protein DL766_006233 [Monosporascus sp. MC13-8B]
MLAAKKTEADAATVAKRQKNKRLTAKRLAAAAEKNVTAVDDATNYLTELVAVQKRTADAFKSIQKGLVTF